MPRLIPILLLLSGLAVAQPAKRALGRQAVPPHLLMERLSRMTTGERDRLLSGLPAERRHLVEERLKRYDGMPSGAKQQLREEYTFFQHLPANKQQEVRKIYKQFSDIPVERRRDLRRELVRLRNMPAERRSARIGSEKFRSEYSESEREILGALTDILTRPAAEQPPEP